MKLCPKCGTENSDSQMFCENCSSPLLAAKSIKTQGGAESFFVREEKKERRNKLLSVLPFVLYYLLSLPLGIRCFIQERTLLPVLLLQLFLPLPCWLLRFHTKGLFFLEHMLKIENPEEAEPSDWYYFCSHISAYVILGLGMYLLFRICLELF